MNKLSLKGIGEELLQLLEEYDILELEGVSIEGDIELDLDDVSGGGVDSQVLGYLGQEIAQAALHLMNASKVMGIDVSQAYGTESPVAIAQDLVLKQESFSIKPKEWMGEIEEVTLGATSSDGGTRSHIIKLGGHKALPFYSFDHEQANRPVVAVDVFDMAIPLAKSVKVHYEDVMDSPGEWAKKAVRDFNADLVTIHLVSTDPNTKDTSPKEAAKAVEEVLQAVKVPLIIGGSGNPGKDPEVLEKAAEIAQGERCMIASANLDMDWERIARAAVDNGHVILAWTSIDITGAKTLNKYLLNKAKVPREDIVMDPTTAALGYGLDFAFTNMERIRMSGLSGDKDLAFPIFSGTTNAWGAREAWMVESPMEQDTDWGPREYRGPIWEIVTGLTLLMAGTDCFAMMHPAAVQAVKEVALTLMGEMKGDEIDIANWVREV